MTEPSLYTFEGLDGAGKTTNVHRLKSSLEHLGVAAITLSSPSRSPLGQFVRQHFLELPPEIKDGLFIVDMEQSLREIPANKDVILFDRYVDSIFSSNTHTDREELLKQTASLPVPKRTFLLDITPELSWQREGAVSDHSLDIEWLRFKHSRYQELVTLEPDRIYCVDASRPLSVVHDDLLSVVLNDLNLDGEP